MTLEANKRQSEEARFKNNKADGRANKKDDYRGGGGSDSRSQSARRNHPQVAYSSSRQRSE